MNNFKKLATAVAVMGCFSTFGASAQTPYNPSWYVMPSVNAMDSDNKFNTSKKEVGVGLRFGKALSQSWDLQTGVTISRNESNTDQYTQTTLGADALYMFSREKFRPFLLIGGGAERSRLKTPGGNMSATSPFLNAGAGFQLGLTPQWFMQTDLRRVHSFGRDNTFGTKSSDNTVLTFGISYLFEKPAMARVAYVAPAPAPYVAPYVAPAPAYVAPAPVYVAPAPVYVAPPPPAPAARFERVTLSATELFEFDRAELRMPQPKLDEIARIFTNANANENITITGYTDRLGSDAYNQPLSERRAAAVKGYLASKGIADGRMTSQGKGESNPVVTCNDKNRAALITCLEPNRRVEVEQFTIERRVN